VSIGAKKKTAIPPRLPEIQESQVDLRRSVEELRKKACKMLVFISIVAKIEKVMVLSVAPVCGDGQFF